MTKKPLMSFGSVFIALALAGSIPNTLIGAHGIFLVDRPHNLMHLIIGVALFGVGCLGTKRGQAWLVGIGGMLVLISLIGFAFLVPSGELFGFIAMNRADHVLHALLGVVLVVFGFLKKKELDADEFHFDGARPEPSAE